MSGFFSMGKGLLDMAVQSASSAVDSMKAHPTTMDCSNCKQVLAVPLNLFNYLCKNCGTTNDTDLKACGKCKTVKPINPNEHMLACGICQNIVKVPTTNAEKTASNAWSFTKEVAISAKDAVVVAYDDEMKTPTTVKCKNCTNVLGVPQGVFDWHCERPGCVGMESRTRLDGNISTCPLCKGQKIDKPLPRIQCGVCQNVIYVPRSNARKHLDQAADATSKAFNSAKEMTVAAYQHQVGKPVNFYCSVCSALLARPCNAQGEPDLSVNEVCCGKCLQVVKVPSSNWRNSISDSFNKITKFGYVGWYEISGKPYVKCVTCNEPVELVSNQAQICCHKCKTIVAKQ